jgi:hypothetical protein
MDDTIASTPRSPRRHAQQAPLSTSLSSSTQTSSVFDMFPKSNIFYISLLAVIIFACIYFFLHNSYVQSIDNFYSSFCTNIQDFTDSSTPFYYDLLGNGSSGFGSSGSTIKDTIERIYAKQREILSTIKK